MRLMQVVPADMAQIISYYQANADRYDETYKGRIDLAENAVLVPKLKAVCDGMRVLDLGCGTGFVREVTKPKVYAGVDASPRMVELAKSKFPLDGFYKGPQENLVQFRPWSFDTVVSTFALSHSPTPHKCLTEVRRVLKPGGSILFVLYGTEWKGRTSDPNLSNVPANVYTCADAEALFRSCGFENILAKPFNISVDRIKNWPLPVWLLRALLEREINKYGRASAKFVIVEGSSVCRV